MMSTVNRKRVLLLLLCLALPTTSLASGATDREWRQRAAVQLEQWLTSRPAGYSTGCGGQGFDLREAIVRFYRYRGFELSWVDQHGLLPAGDMALAAVRGAADRGLHPDDYLNPRMEDQLEGLIGTPVVYAPGVQSVVQHVQLDLLLTEMMLRFAHDLIMGRTAGGPLVFGEAARQHAPRDPAVELARMVSANRMEDFLAQLGPRHAAYHALQKRLADYQRIRAAGGWPVIEEGATLRPGDRDLRVALLRYRLSISGDTQLDPGWIDENFDGALAEAVIRFQHRHGLQADGVVGANTLAALNVPVDRRIDQIRLNLERWRWMPAELGAVHMLVNIPAFQLQIVEAGQTVRTLRAIVGRKSRPTPVLSSTMTYLELNPYWHVPPKIAREDLLPKIQEDPLFLVRQDFRVFDGWGDDARELDPLLVEWSSFSRKYFPLRLRQEPTAHNALGRVKFMFPNALSVYIHDTPSKNLFARPTRDFSSGCIRVDEPLELAAFLLGRQNWDPQRLAEAMVSDRRQVAIFKEPVPVHLVYLTAWVDADGQVNFREDIYGHDRQLADRLTAGGSPRPGCDLDMNHPIYFVRLDPPASADHSQKGM